MGDYEHYSNNTGTLTWGTRVKSIQKAEDFCKEGKQKQKFESRTFSFVSLLQFVDDKLLKCVKDGILN